jgi:hypothetical protein
MDTTAFNNYVSELKKSIILLIDEFLSNLDIFSFIIQIEITK